MTAELIRGQNHPLPGNRLEIRVSAGTQVVAAVTLGDEQGRIVGGRGAGGPEPDGREPGPPGWLAHPGEPQLPGVDVPRQAAADQRLAVDLGAMPESVHRVHVLLALPEGRPGGPLNFGAAPAPHLAVTTTEGTVAAGFTITGLGAETALLAVELYRRQGAWKVRAVGQGFQGGLPALLLDLGVPEPAAVAEKIHAAVDRGRSRSVTAPARADGEATTGVDYRHPGRRAESVPSASSAPAGAEAGAGAGAAAGAGTPPVPVAGDATGWTMEERLHNQVWGMFEDLARSVAAYRSAEDFAQSRYEQDLDRLLADPRTRGGAGAESAREQAEARRLALIDQARAVLDRDLAQLAAESEVVEPALPPAFAGWENPAWHGYRVPTEAPLAVRLGSLSLSEAPELRIPLLARLPLERGLWIDSAEDRRLAMETAVALAARLLASYPVGGFAVHALDPAGSGAPALAPLHAGGALVLPPPAAGAAGVSDLLGRLTGRVDLLHMALRGDAADALPPGFDTAQQLLIVNEFPYGFDDRAVNQLRYLADEGPAVGVHLMLVADREDASAYGPVLDPLWRSMLRLTPLPSDHLADPWVGHAWTYEPALVPPGSQVLAQVLRQLAAARPAFGT
ncbi:TerD family protein [Streptomyces sp.]|uniref:TerD family protein n=1 Tax=Streptomyces sp. TaxID=1931 RepID=UPI002F429EC0